MIQFGHIRIKDNKVYFEPKGLEKPDPLDYDGYGIIIYQQKLKAYEASKQLIEVENVIYDDLIEHTWLINMDDLIIPKNNQPCEAEVENNKAVIIKINRL